MIQKDKQISLIDLCARVPYHPKGHVVNACNGAECDEWLTCATFPLFVNMTNNCRLYLRPMSSMTKEEENLFSTFRTQIRAMNNYNDFAKECNKLIYWLNKNMFDYRGLIPKGLAIEAPKDMYGKAEQE